MGLPTDFIYKYLCRMSHIILILDWLFWIYGDNFKVAKSVYILN